MHLRLWQHIGLLCSFQVSECIRKMRHQLLVSYKILVFGRHVFNPIVIVHILDQDFEWIFFSELVD